MNAIVIEHVKLEELPAAWQAKFIVAPGTQGRARVRVRIEAEDTEEQSAAPLTDNPLFGMWRDRKDMSDVAGYIRAMRAPRFTDDGAPRKR